MHALSLILPMLKRKTILRSGFAILCILLVVLGIGYNTYRQTLIKAAINEKAIRQMQIRCSDPWNKHAVDSAIHVLKTGDLVVRRGIDASSFLLSQLNKHDKKYSHCGLVLIENGYPFVYHFIGGEDNPNEKIRRDSASYFFSPRYNLAFGIYRFDSSYFDAAILATFIKQQFALHKKFDMYFDLRSDDRYYCSEFVYKALVKAGPTPCFINTEKAMGYTYVGIDNLYQNAGTRMVWQVDFK